MQTKTELHQLLRDFRDLTGAELCSLVSERGARVYVGRPTTLSAEQLGGRKRGDKNAGEADDARRLTKTTIGYAITVEFDSEEAANKARGSFEDLVGIIDEMVSNDPEPESTTKPSSD
jgi:hypothetical protein